MSRRSFRDPRTHVLKAWGNVETNEPGDLARDEPDDFALAPGEWKWDGAAWVPVAAPLFEGVPVTSAADVDRVTARRIGALIGGRDPVQAQLDRLRRVVRALFVATNATMPDGTVITAADKATAVQALTAFLALDDQIAQLRTEAAVFIAANGLT